MNTPNAGEYRSAWIARHLRSTQVLAALYYKRKLAILPEYIDCPFCKGQMFVYPDIQFGDWLYCNECKAAMDILEFACHVWQMDCKNTLTRLKEHDITVPKTCFNSVALEDYDKILRYRERLRALWASCANYNINDSDELRQLHDSLGLSLRKDEMRWREQMSKFVGFSTRKDWVEVLGTNNHLKVHDMKDDTRWQGAVVLPVHDMPGRMTGAAIGVRDGIYPNDWGVWAAYYKPSTAFTSNIGLGFYDAGKSVVPIFGNYAFAMQNPRMALRMHSKWFKEYSTTLPLVFYIDTSAIGATCESAWLNLPVRNWVFWSDRPDKTVFSQAAIVNGRVTICPPCELDTMAAMTSWLHKIKDQSKPWIEVLDLSIPHMTDAELYTAWSRLPNRGEEHKRIILEKLTQANQDRIRVLSSMNHSARQMVVLHDKTKIIERDGGWWTDKDVMISNVIVRIDEIRQKYKVNVVGRILSGNRVAPFECHMTRFMKQPTMTIQEALVEANLPLAIIRRGSQRKLFDIAIAFHEPKVGRLKERFRQDVEPLHPIDVPAD